ncbi:MAG: uroporphyrinogen-III C-methyltransferase [Pseudomonadota bacterium]
MTDGSDNKTNFNSEIADPDSSTKSGKKRSEADGPGEQELESQDVLSETSDAQVGAEAAQEMTTDQSPEQATKSSSQAQTSTLSDQHDPEQIEPAGAVESADEMSETSPAVATKPGRALAWIGLMLALLGIAGVGYLYYLLIHLAPMDEVLEQQVASNRAVQTLEQELRELVTAQSGRVDSALAQTLAEQDEQLRNTTEQIRENLARALNAAPPSRREWKLAEAEYLMRIANHRVLMEDDATGALELLLAADQILAELDDFSLHTVRARLADEIVALRQVRRDDLQGVFLSIESLKNSARQLNFRRPVKIEPEPEEVAQMTVTQKLWESIAAFVRLRSLDDGQTFKPLLAPEEERFVELNLQLALQQSQLAVLERHQDVYVTSLDTAASIIEGYMRQDEAAQATVEQLNELVQVDLSRQLPDVSGSLNELLGVVRPGDSRP